MMARKHLHELLEEDQEPFILENYIADKRCRLQKPSPTIHLQIERLKPFSQNSNFPSNFCKKACFLASRDSPDLIKQPPLFEAKSPNAVFLLEAALRIQKQSSSKTKSRYQNSNGGAASGLFGSILKRLKYRAKNPKRETANAGTKASVKDISKWDLVLGKKSVFSEEKRGCEMGFSSSCNEEKSMDMDSGASCSCSHSEDFEEISMCNGVLEHNSAFDKHFSQNPFHFLFQTTPSPSRHEREEKQNHELQSLKRLQVEEEKEQCSPVSVLDRPFEDDDRHRDDNDAEEADNGMKHFDLECTFAIVQRAKQQFLQKLCRFEKLAELDPMELEKRMLEQEQDNESPSSQSEMNIDVYNLKSHPDCMKRLVSDLIAEEEMASRHVGCIDKQAGAAERVRERLDAWEDVESNTIDMMVEQDFRRDKIEGWKGNKEQIREIVIEVERGIFGLLMQELGAKQQFLQKLCRFEKLAELDPMELEKRMLEQEQDNESPSSQSEMNIDVYNLKSHPDCMKRLVSDLIAEEEMASRHDGCIDKQAGAAERVRKRLDAWEYVESNTIDMMVEQDFRRDKIEGWKGNEEEIREIAMEVERGIFGLLMQELSEELVFDRDGRFYIRSNMVTWTQTRRETETND
ncbi:hypothetical protein V6N13_067507 [Hibiscus sabdariffa]